MQLSFLRLVDGMFSFTYQISRTCAYLDLLATMGFEPLVVVCCVLITYQVGSNKLARRSFRNLSRNQSTIISHTSIFLWVNTAVLVVELLM